MRKTLIDIYISGKDIKAEDVIEYICSDIDIISESIPLSQLAMEAMSREVNNIKYKKQ